MICDVCGKEFFIKSPKEGGRFNQKHCSKQCVNKCSKNSLSSKKYVNKILENKKKNTKERKNFRVLWDLMFKDENNKKYREYRRIRSRDPEVQKNKSEYEKSHRQYGRTSSKNYKEKYPERIKVAIAKYQKEHPEVGKKCHAKRRRQLGWIPLNEHFKGCHSHHINDTYIINIPKELHLKYVGHKHKAPETMIEINQQAFLYLNPDIPLYLVESWTLSN